MKKSMIALAVAALGMPLAVPPAFAASVGKPAPGFTAKDTYGKVHRLSELKGKFVVLEWHNQDCPFVKSQYNGKMQKLQKTWTNRGVLWFTVLSSARSSDCYVNAKKANEDVKRSMAGVTAVLMDTPGTLGHAYGAKTTPHMFVINTKGILIYGGAVDNAPLQDREASQNNEGKPYVNYVDQALHEAMLEGKDVSIPTTPPYGCNVKYGK